MRKAIVYASVHHGNTEKLVKRIAEECQVDLMDAVNLIAGEKVYIADNNNGERFETYVIKGERGSGCVCLNGAAARKVQVGDVIIIMSYALMDFEEAKTFKPMVAFPDAENKLSR